MFVCGGMSASLCMVFLCFSCSMFGSGLSFWWVCLLAGLLSNCSIVLFTVSWNSLMNSSLSALWLVSNEFSSSSNSSWSLSWSWGGSFATSCCHTLSVHLPDIPVSSHLSVDRCLRTCFLVFGGISSTLLSSITASVMSLMLCVSGVSPVSFLTVLASLPNAAASSSSSCSSQLSIMFLCVTTHLVIFLYMLLLIGLSPIPPMYFRIHPRSSIDLSLTHFLSLLQYLLLGCTIWYLGNTVLNCVLHKNYC